MILLGIDTGGTFTDFVLVKGISENNIQLNIHKVLSTPSAPEVAILQGINELGLDFHTKQDFYIVHGSTVATNAVLEGKGVRTVYIANRGLADVLTIGRQARRELYNLQPRPYPPPVPKQLCLETGGRVSATGEIIEPLLEEDLDSIKQQIGRLKPRAVAINLLFSYLDDQFEKQIAAIIPPDIFVSRSSVVLPEIKEYERGITTWLNAAVGPIVQGYLQRLSEGVNKKIPEHGAFRSHISVMQSAGGTIEASQAATQAVHMLLSGPAGGMAGAKYIAGCAGKTRLLTFDMGGTSTDVALIDGDLQLTNEGHIGSYPVAVPMVDMHTIGAGGGSIASIDPGGLLQVGPQSAGAEPGPACYKRGGRLATVTDANLVLGRLRSNAFLGGSMELDVSAARKAIESLANKLNLDIEKLAEGIVRLANEHMARALRVMSVQRGIDPRQLTLVSFGGAGGLHVCALAEALSMRQALVPVHAGVLSALGMLVAPRARYLSQTLNDLVDNIVDSDLDKAIQAMFSPAKDALLQEGLEEQDLQTEPSVDLRYHGQSYTLNIPWMGKTKTVGQFHVEHERRYGHRLTQPVELVTVRVKVSGKSQTLKESDASLIVNKSKTTKVETAETITIYGIGQPVPVMHRDSLSARQIIIGPALITETVSTTFIQQGWQGEVDQVGNLALSFVG